MLKTTFLFNGKNVSRAFGRERFGDPTSNKGIWSPVICGTEQDNGME